MSKVRLALRYSAAIQRLRPAIQAGATLQSPTAFYECRNQPRWRLQVKELQDGSKKRSFVGMLDSGYAACLALPTMHAALRAARIGFECGETPGEYGVFSRTKTHKSMFGFLEEDVFCRIIAPFSNLPQPEPLS
jgi:hypothetical protein